MNEEDKDYFAGLEKILSNILEDDQKKLSATNDKRSQIKSARKEAENQIEESNKGIFFELSEIFEDIKNSNSANNGKVQAFQKLAKHINDLLEAKKYFQDASNRKFCGAIFHLKNHVDDYRLSLERKESFLDNGEKLTSAEEKPQRQITSDYNKPEFTAKQILFVMKELRKLKFTTSDITNTKMAEGLQTLTGFSKNTLRQDLSETEIKLSEEDKSILKDMLQQINKAIDKL